MEIQFGLSKPVRNEAAESLSDFLANTYALYLKTQSFHWNVVGAEFFSVHLLLEKHYEEMANAVDEIAERIRTLGVFVDASFSAFKKRTSLPESIPTLSLKEMIHSLVEGHELLARMGRPFVARFSDLRDEASADLVIRRLIFHEKASWMLRSHLS